MPIIDPFTGDFTLEEKIRRLKVKLDEKPEPPPPAIEEVANLKSSQKSIKSSMGMSQKAKSIDKEKQQQAEEQHEIDFSEYQRDDDENVKNLRISIEERQMEEEYQASNRSYKIENPTPTPHHSSFNRGTPLISERKTYMSNP